MIVLLIADVALTNSFILSSSARICLSMYVCLSTRSTDVVNLPVAAR